MSQFLCSEGLIHSTISNPSSAASNFTVALFPAPAGVRPRCTEGGSVMWCAPRCSMVGGMVRCGVAFGGKSVSDTAGAQQRVAPHRPQQWTDCPQSKRRTWRPCHQTDTRLRHQRRGRCLNVCDVIKGREDRRKIRPLMGCTSLANISQQLGTLCVLVDLCASGRTCASRSNCTEQPISHFFDFLFVHCKLILCADGTGKKRGVHIRIQYVGGWGCGRVDACVRVRVCEAA